MKITETLESHLIKKFGSKINSMPIQKIEDYAVTRAKLVIHNAILKASHNQLARMQS